MRKQYLIWNDLFAIGESQLSNLWQTKSNLGEQIPEEIKDKTSKATKIEEVKNFKTDFDKVCKDFKNEVLKKTNESMDEDFKNEVLKQSKREAVYIWKPVFDWIIKQCPNIYTFQNVENQPYLKRYGVKEEIEFKYINGYGKKLNHNPADDLNKYFERMVAKTNRLMYLGILLLSFYTIVIGAGNFYFPDNPWFFVPLIAFIFYFSWLVRHKKSVLHPSNFKVPNPNTTLLSLLPRNKTLSYQEVEKDKENSLLLKIDIFKDHSNWVDYLEKVESLDLKPTLYQHTDYVQIEQQIGNGDTFLKLVSKKFSKNPLEVYFKDEVAMIIREEFHQHNLVEEIFSKIDFSTLDIPMIIQEYLESKKNV